jgi:hypothetical protein
MISKVKANPLNSKDIKSEVSTEKLGKGSYFVLFGFIIGIIFLVNKRKQKYNKNEFR